ncbi:MAG: ArsR family transcriptional regulator [Thermodesulfobacteriota bacterium]
MREPERVTAKEIYDQLREGRVLLVCAYEDDSKFKMMHLQGGISFDEFKSKLPSVPKDQEIIFY